MPWLSLLLSWIALATGPLSYNLLTRRRDTAAIVDGFVCASITALILLHVLPEAYGQAGAAALGAAALGLALPLVLERLHSASTSRLIMSLALGGLLLHTAFDGAGLATGDGGHHHMALVAAILLHRLPASLGLWWLVRPRRGRRAAWGLLGLMGVCTTLGFWMGPALMARAGDGASLLQAFVSGSLLHVLVHHAPHGKAKVGREAIGALFGVLTVVGALSLGHHSDIAHHHTHALTGYAQRFWHLALESAPALLLGFGLAGIVTTALPQASRRWLRGSTSLTQAARGVLFGLPIPICSCGVVPLYQSLVRQGAPPAAAIAFLIATPELSVEALLLSGVLLGGKLTAARLIAAGAVALIVGMIMARLIPDVRADLQEAPPRDVRPWALRLRAAAHQGFVTIVDDTAPWIVAGLAIAAVIEPEALAGLVNALPWGIDVVVFAAVGLPLYVCASGATPLAAALLLAGVSPGAAVAFLLAGPATNVTTFGVLSQLHGRRMAAVFGAAVVGVAILSGLLINLVLGRDPAQLVEHAHRAEDFGWFHWLTTALMAAFFAASLWRRGPRAWLRDVATLGSHSHAHEHVHGPDCGLDHAHTAACGHEPHVHGLGCGHDHALAQVTAPKHIPKISRVVGAVKPTKLSSPAQDDTQA